jgi:serine/threonine protein kinase
MYQFGDVKLFSATDNANKTKRLIKYDTRKNENEIKILRGLSDQDRLLQLIEGFSFKENGTNTFALVYSYAMPVTDFITIRHKYSEELVVKILRQVIDAVQWLHLHGFVHLNVHPFTVLNTNYTQVNVKLGGFENSHQINELDETAATTSTSGSIHDEIRQPIEFTGKLTCHSLIKPFMSQATISGTKL